MCPFGPLQERREAEQGNNPQWQAGRGRPACRITHFPFMQTFTKSSTFLMADGWYLRKNAIKIWLRMLFMVSYYIDWGSEKGERNVLNWFYCLEVFLFFQIFQRCHSLFLTWRLRNLTTLKLLLIWEMYWLPRRHFCSPCFLRSGAVGEGTPQLQKSAKSPWRHPECQEMSVSLLKQETLMTIWYEDPGVPPSDSGLTARAWLWRAAISFHLLL